MKKNNFKSLMQAAVLICTPLVIASCDDVFGDVDNPIPSYMSIKEADVTLVLHKDSLDKATYTRTATAATGAEIVYSSSNEKVATVDAKTGKITAVGGGECEIIAQATGKDSHGNMTYQPAQSSFKVKVTDYRARIALKEGVEIPVYNSALASTAKPIALKDILDVWPALDTKGLTVTYTVTEADSKKPVIKSTASNEITLNNQAGSAKVKASIAKGNVPKEYEQASFAENQETAEFTIEVKQGVAYVSGYDAKGVAIQKYMFKDYNNEEYTNLSDVLKGGDDVALAAGWYYLNDDINFKQNIRIKGDVNIILGDGKTLTMAAGKSIMDESAKNSYKLNFFPETKTADGTISAATAKIQDFKEVNVVGVKLVNVPVEKVGDVTIIKGELGNLTGTGNVNITDGTVDDLTGFATVTLAKGTAVANDLKTIGTAIISEGTTVNDMSGITSLTINKAKTIGALDGDIETATLTGVTAKAIDGVKTLTLNEVKVSKDMTNVGTVTIKKTDGQQTFTNIVADALIIDDGDIEVSKRIYAYDSKNKKETACKLTVNGGKLFVGKTLSDDNKVAVLGDVAVTKGEFTAWSNYHAVEGALTGTFYGSTDKTNWTKIENEDRPKFITTIEPKK